MRILFISFTMLISVTVAFGQKVKKMTVENQSPPYIETFYVLKSDGQTKHGMYEKEMFGRLWVKGEFQNGVKTGIWEYYDLDGVLEQKMDAQTKEILYHNFGADSTEYDLLKLPRPAIPIGGMSLFYRHVMFEMRYPRSALRMATEGKVDVMFTVDELGKMGDAVIIKGIGNGCDEEALRVIKMFYQKWLPALDENGKAVKSEVTLPIIFRLD